MQNVKLPNDLTNEERDAMLLQLLSQKSGKTYLLKPPTEAGMTISKKFGEMLHNDVADGRIGKAISDTTEIVEIGMEDALSSGSWAACRKVSKEIEHALSYKILTTFEAAHQELIFKLQNVTDFEPISDADTWIGDSRNNGAFSNLMAEIKNSLPEIVSASASWVIDGNVIDDRLSSIIDSFIDEHVVKIVEDGFSSIRSIQLKPEPCDIEKSGGTFNG